MQIDFALQELGNLYRKGKEKENRNVQIPGEGVAPMSQLRDIENETFYLLIFRNGANRSPIFCVCSLFGKLASSSFSMQHSLCCCPLALSAYMTGLQCRGRSVQRGFVFKSGVRLQSPATFAHKC